MILYLTIAIGVNIYAIFICTYVCNKQSVCKLYICTYYMIACMDTKKHYDTGIIFELGCIFNNI